MSLLKTINDQIKDSDAEELEILNFLEEMEDFYDTTNASDLARIDEFFFKNRKKKEERAAVRKRLIARGKIGSVERAKNKPTTDVTGMHAKDNIDKDNAVSYTHLTLPTTPYE